MRLGFWDTGLLMGAGMSFVSSLAELGTDEFWISATIVFVAACMLDGS